MIGWLIAVAVLAAAAKAKQSAASPSNTVVSVGVPSIFGNAPPQGPAQTLNREQFHVLWQDWQNPDRPSIPVPPGSAQDYYATGKAKSDVKLAQEGGGLQIYTPADDQNRRPVSAAGGGAVSGGGGSSGGSSGGGTSPSGGGGLSGSGRRILLQ